MPGGVSIVIAKGSEVGKKFFFDQAAISIGRDAAEKDIVLNDDSISSRHAKITFEAGNYFLQDLGSTNKTYFKGAPLKELEKVQLKNGDEFSLGKVVLRFNGKTGGSGTKEILSQTQDLKAKKNVKTSDGGTGPKLKNKPLLTVAVAVVLLLVLMSVIKVTQSSKTEKAEIQTSPDNSLQPMALLASKIYGYCESDWTHPDKAIFTFTAKSGNVEIYYMVGGIESDGEVIILLNGTRVANAPLSMKGWGPEQHLFLPSELINEGGENQLVFDNTKNPPGEDQWGVKDLRIEFLATDNCDETEGKRLFELGNQMYMENAVSEGNIYRAYKYYAAAVTQVKRCVPESIILSKIESKMQTAGDEFDRRYDNFVFSYKKAIKFKRYSQAKSDLERILRLIPEAKDERHKEAIRLLMKINGYLRRLNSARTKTVFFADICVGLKF